MRHRWFPVVAVALIAIATLALGAAPHALAQTPPARFFGALTLDGSPAPAGTEVVAYIGDVECGRASTTDAGRYVLDVKSSGSQAGCGEEDAAVRFTVAGAAADQTGTFKLGHFIALDISATSGSAAPPPSSPPPAEEPPPPSEEPPPPAEEPPPPGEEPPSE